MPDIEFYRGGNSLIAWEALRDEAAGCTRCPLYKPATQTVFGEGPIDAPLMFVGEQPGDQEDVAGRPFVGPAGQMFDRALYLRGTSREELLERLSSVEAANEPAVENHN